MTALVKSLHLIHVQYAKQITIKTDIMIVFTQNVALLILARSYEM